MNHTYDHIATVSCRHQYFKAGLFKPLVFSIEKNSVKLMRDMGIVLKQFSGGFHLLAYDTELLASEKNEKSLQIHFKCTDSHYINYTNLPGYLPGEDLLYFSNISTQSAPDDNIRSLHSGDFVDSGDVVRLSHGKIKIPSFDPTGTYVFLEASNENLPLDNIQESSLDPGEFSISNYREGLVQIQSGGEVVHKVYFQPNVVWKKPLGTIELFTATLSDHFKDKGKVRYEINFNNRHTYWKYFLVDPVYQKFDALSIINKEKEPVFNSAQKQQIQESTDAIVFESINKLPLLEYSEHTFQLVDNYNAELRSGKVIIKNLVHPSPEQLFLESPPNDEFIYSHIYI